MLPPQWPAAGGASSCFEGVAAADLQIAGFFPITNGDFNAYENLRYNLIPLGGHPALSLPVTVVRPNAGGSPGIPTIDIAPMTGGVTTGVDRGILYIRDSLFNGSQPGGPFTGSGLPAAPALDLSPGDLRLCPDTAPFTTLANPPVPPGNGGARSLLVDRGWNGPFPVTMANGRILTAPPGQKKPPGDPHWYFNSWDTDCEGFGNVRIFDHPRYNPNNPSDGTIDIGADELGSNIAVGYRFATTIFMLFENLPPDPQPPLPPFSSVKNKFIWFFGPANDNGQSVPALPGDFPSYTDGWPLTNGLPHMDTWDPNPAATYYDPEIVDIPPHLLPDIHPWWGLWLLGKASNPQWFHSACNSPNFYNPSIFNFPSVGHINPPGSVDNTGAPVNFYWLEETNPTTSPPQTLARSRLQVPANFVPGGQPWLNSFGIWCQSKGTNPPQGPLTDHGTWQPTFPYQQQYTPPFVSLRYSTEFDRQRSTPNFLGPPYGDSYQASNLQSFMVLVEGEQ